MREGNEMRLNSVSSVAKRSTTIRPKTSEKEKDLSRGDQERTPDFFQTGRGQRSTHSEEGTSTSWGPIVPRGGLRKRFNTWLRRPSLKFGRKKKHNPQKNTKKKKKKPKKNPQKKKKPPKKTTPPPKKKRKPNRKTPPKKKKKNPKKKTKNKHKTTNPTRSQNGCKN